MVLIISEHNDYITDRVIEWLYNLDIQDVVRIKEDDKIEIESVDFVCNEIVIRVAEQGLDFAEVDFYRYRRGNLSHLFASNVQIGDKKVEQQVTDFLEWEWLVCSNYLLSNMHKKAIVGELF
ncbi:hypothetical protein DMA11_00600 [Marinilabiliaceae bacterium JC017]|nr:hypothetical protein DMA11_00600 [Marinilabiliaceae bacterium JC017]